VLLLTLYFKYETTAGSEGSVTDTTCKQ